MIKSSSQQLTTFINPQKNAGAPGKTQRQEIPAPVAGGLVRVTVHLVATRRATLGLEATDNGSSHDGTVSG